ncbi:MAG TPA: hypothetical protein VJR30_17365 [Bradyrhizobium sp.]|nr:hypothetical protein [Bradyrhizobium sp.]
MFDLDRLPIPFLARAADILGDTARGLSGRAIVTAFLKYGERWDVNVPYPETLQDAGNKRNAILESLKRFSGQQQFIIIEELSQHNSFAVGAPSKDERVKLRHDLHMKHSAFKTETLAKELDLPLVEETRHWLETYPAALALFDQAKAKYDLGGMGRNVLDDLRLALEKLLHAVLDNDKSLEHQMPLLGKMLKGKGASKELANMLDKLLRYYCDYQNDHVKHDDDVKEEEIEIVFEMTAAFMKHIVRVSR